jgi:aminoglycoside phosphotransferase (APT) family kinase protein
MNLQQPGATDLSREAEALQGWLRERLEWRDATVTDLHRSPFGSANETLLVTVVRQGSSEPLAVKRAGGALVVYNDTDLSRQAATITWVGEHVDVPVPKVIGVERSSDVLGAEFMITTRLPGVAAPDYPGYNIAGFILEGGETFRRRLWEGALDILCRLHVADSSSIDFLGSREHDGLEHLVAHWQASAAWTSEHCDVDRVVEVLDLLAARVPVDAPRGLSWGDARIANMLFVGPQCTGVLDWEMASLGGPLVDLAWWLMFDLIQSDDLGVGRLPGLGDRQETIDRWQRRTGHPVSALVWFDVLAHAELALTRAVVFAQRAKAGLGVPDDDDPRSVRRLVERIDRILDDGGLA